MKKYITVTALILSVGQAQSVEKHWEWKFPERQVAWEHVQRIGSDRSYPVFVQDELVLVSCEYNGALLALDATTGAEAWRFHTEGPLRKAATGDGERIFIGGESGTLYCLDKTGKLLWKKRGGPSGRKVLGHGRLISAWPIMASPLVKGDTVYFTAGYWPMEGVYCYALDTKTGKVKWKASGIQARPYMLRTHENWLIMEGHNSGAMYDLASGRPVAEKRPKRPPIERPDVPGLGGTWAGSLEGDRHFSVSDSGIVVGYGPEKKQAKTYQVERKTVTTKAAANLLARAKAKAGYAVVAGVTDGSLVKGLLGGSELKVVAVTKDAKGLSQRLDEAGLFSSRLAIVEGDAGSVDLPPYFANLVTTESKAKLPARAQAWVRPFGGILAQPDNGKWQLQVREGPLEGAADWQQEFFNAANTLKSTDTLVKAPLGLLWYGGAVSGAKYYYDGKVDHQSGHGTNPNPVMAETIEGRMILQSPGLISAFDMYTGRLLWESELPSVYTYGGSGGGLGVHSKKHKSPMTYEAAQDFDLKPYQRSRASGFDYASMADGIYLCVGPELLRIDPKDGERLSAWPVPIDEKDLCWGGLRIEGDVLVATAFRPKDHLDAEAGHDGNGGDWSGDRMRMSYMIALDRQTGKKLWQREATWGFVNRSGICIGGGKVFATDVLTPKIYDKFKAAGRKFPTASPKVLALDLRTGKEAWSFDLDVLSRNIAYSAEKDLLLVPCRNLVVWENNQWVNKSMDVRRGKTNKNAPGRMRAFKGSDGSIVWQVDDNPYHRPHVIHGDILIDRSGYTYNLTDGKRALRKSPVTGQMETWSFRKGGCNHLIASENLVTWRTGYYNLENQSGATSLTGLDAGCAPTLIPAGGVLNVPNFGTHHKRNRMTAMALVHRPDNPSWSTYYSTSEKSPDPSGAPIRRIGYNFGAPGDRITEDGTLWQRIDRFKRYDLSMEPRDKLQWVAGGPEEEWVGSSGLSGVESIRIPVLMKGGKGEKNDKATRTYTVRMHFAGVEGLTVELEGKPVVTNLTTSGPLVKEFKSVSVTGPLDLELSSGNGVTMINGLELLLEE